MKRENLHEAEWVELFRAGSLVKLLARCKQIVAETRQQHGDVHPSVAMALGTLALTYYELDDIEAAADTLKEQLEVEHALSGEESEDYVGCLNNLARMNLFCGRESVAEVMLLRAHELIARL